MTRIFSGIFLILLIGAAGYAQKQKTSPDAEQEIKPAAQTKKSPPNGNVLLESGTSLEARLEQTLDVKNAAVGDEIVLTTTKTVRQNGQTAIKKGTRLIGRVTEVQRKTKDNAQTKLGVVFDRLESGNLSAPFSATIVSITKASVNTTVDDTLETGMSGNSAASGSVSRSGSGGGLLSGVTNTVGSVVDTSTRTVGGLTNTAGQTLDGTTRSVGQTLTGIRLSQSADASAGGATTLSTQNKNLRLDKGITFQLRLTESVGVN